jgi:hypothetical protein
MNELDAIDYWHFCDELTIAKAILLIFGVDPSEIQDDILGDNPYFKPSGFDAVFIAMTNDIQNKKLNAIIRYPAFGGGFSEYPHNDNNEPCWRSTTVHVSDLKAWLLSKNYKPAFFFGEQSSNEPDYMNPQHPRYSAKLAATVMAWQAMDDENFLLRKSAKDAMIDWLTSRYKELGLTYENKISIKAIKECATVANWSRGGAPTTPENANLPTP